MVSWNQCERFNICFICTYYMLHFFVFHVVLLPEFKHSSPVKNLWRIIFAKITVFLKNLHHCCLTRFYISLWLFIYMAHLFYVRFTFVFILWKHKNLAILLSAVRSYQEFIISELNLLKSRSSPSKGFF